MAGLDIFMDNDMSKEYGFIFRLDKRVGYLEKDIKFIEQRIDSLTVEGKEHYEELKDELTSISDASREISGLLKKASLVFSRTGLEMKDVVKKDQLDAVSERVESIDFAGLITRKELQ